jgi:uncharacterized protein (TIGR02466 family)
MPVEYFFPKAFYYKDDIISETENEKLKQAAFHLRDQFKISSRPNLYTTYGIIPNVLERKEFDQLKLLIYKEIEQFSMILETGESYNYVISDAWISISGPGNYERMHTHDGAYISGVYYIKTHPDCGNLFFEEMSDNLWASTRSKPENFNSVSYTPLDRRIILFNSKVPHCVGQNMSSGDRIALSFNVILS